MSLPHYGSLLRVRPEVLSPDQPMVDMISLAEVTGLATPRKKGLAALASQRGLVDDPTSFFQLTYPTHEIREVLRTLEQRLKTPQLVPGVILLESHYGAGKSHVMAAAHHALISPAIAEAWAEQWKLSPLRIPAGARVITLSLIDRSSNQLWELLFEPLGRPDALKADALKRSTPYPDGQTIQALLDEQPLVLILDELERWFDALDPKSQSRNRNFLQALSEVAMRDPRLTLVTSVLGEKLEPGETLRRVRPMVLSFSSTDDRLRILQFRMFENFESRDVQAIGRIIGAYGEAYSRAGLPDMDAYRQRMREAWPFSPEFVDMLIKKVPLRGGFQNTRGTLRFLSIVIRATHDKRPLITSQDLPIRDDALNNILTHLDHDGGEVVRRASVDNFEAVRSSLTLKAPLFSALLFYSIADPSHPGITLQELMLACLGPDINRNVLMDELAQIRRLAYNLHFEQERYVFKVGENPHARIHALASSNRFTHAQNEATLREQLQNTWGAPDRTVLHSGHPHDDRSVQEALQKLGRRVRFLLSTRLLTPEERWRLQNLDIQRNLVLLLEPFASSVRGLEQNSIFHDERLIEHARTLQACNLLLESQPSDEAARVYREVRDQNLRELKQRFLQLYGQHLQWHPRVTEATGPQDHDVIRIPVFSASDFLRYFRQECTSQPQVEARLEQLYPLFSGQKVEALRDHLERTLGEPVLLEDALFFSALRAVAQRKIFALQNERGEIVQELTHLPDKETLGATLVDPPRIPQSLSPQPATLFVHERVSAQLDAPSSSVQVSWQLPPAPPGISWRTLVQRYTSARGWQIGQRHHLDLDTTHSANRYLGGGDSFRDEGPFTPGECQYYYVFLIEDHSQPDPSRLDPHIVLSNRVDVVIPLPPKPDKDVLEISPQPNFGRFYSSVEQTVMSARNMNADSRVRKLEVSLRQVSQHPKLKELIPQLASPPTGIEVTASADFTIVIRGELDRQQLLQQARLLPRIEPATYSARIYLKLTTQPGE